MKKIKYKKLSVQNFLSIGNDAIEVDFHKGLNLVTGVNIDNPERKNAVGKSSLMSAYFFALFGETIGKIKNEFIVNNVTKGKGKIELLFDVETTVGTQSYKIVRQVKPSKVELWKSDEDITRDSIANTNKYICDLLSTNSVIHKSCDIMTLSDTTPFMLKNAAEKRKFIEDIFGIEIFGLMLKDLKKLITENKNDMNISTAVMEELKTSIAAYESQLAEIEKQKSEREEIFNLRKSELESKLDKTQSMLDELPAPLNIDALNIEESRILKAIDQIDDKIAALMTEMADKNKDIKYAQREIAKMSNVDEGVQCESCLQNIEHDHVALLESLVAKHNLDIATYSTEVKALQVNIDIWKTKKTTLQSVLTQNANKKATEKENSQRRVYLNERLLEYRESLDNLKLDEESSTFSTDAFVKNIKTSVEKKTDLDTKITTHKQNDADYDICKFVLGEEGVKSFVVKKLLDMLNCTIAKYLKDLGMPIKCKFDEYFDEEISNGKNKKFSYSNLSGAERRSVDIACVLSFSDMRRKINGVSSNVEFYDEIFDGAFDERGLDLLIGVLKDRISKNNMSVYAISHRKETLKHIDGEIVNLEKENDITRRVKP
jgi:chromosome segregation ATPase